MALPALPGEECGRYKVWGLHFSMLRAAACDVGREAWVCTCYCSRRNSAHNKSSNLSIPSSHAHAACPPHVPHAHPTLHAPHTSLSAPAQLLSACPQLLSAHRCVRPRQFATHVHHVIVSPLLPLPSPALATARSVYQALKCTPLCTIPSAASDAMLSTTHAHQVILSPHHTSLAPSSALATSRSVCPAFRFTPLCLTPSGCC